MARSANQKLKLLYLCQILTQQTDEEHPMTVQELISQLARYDIQAERKSVYDDLDALSRFGVDVQCRKGKHPGWFVGARDFELPELKLLVLAVHHPAEERRADSQAGAPGQRLPGPPVTAAGVCQRPGQSDE